MYERVSDEVRAALEACVAGTLDWASLKEILERGPLLVWDERPSPPVQWPLSTRVEEVARRIRRRI